MASVTVRDLNRLIETKKLERTSTFAKLYQSCENRLLKHAKHHKMRTVFEVPEFMLGVPPFNLNDAIEYMIGRLKKNGFLVRYFFPRILYISWDPEEIQGKKFMQPYTGAIPPLQIATPTITNVERPQQPPQHHVQHRAQHSPSPQPIQTTNHQLYHNNFNHMNITMPSMDLPLPVASAVRNKTTNTVHTTPSNIQNTYRPDMPPTKSKDTFYNSITDYKPSGKFVLNLI